MGSITSFPVLCAVNFAIWLTAQEFGRTRRGLIRQSCEFQLKHGRVLINGDDILFPANRNVHDTFWRVATLSGLSRSVGKSFFNPHWCVVNSEFFDIHRRGAMVTQLLAKEDLAIRTTFYTPSVFIPLGTLFSVSARGVGTGHTTVLSGGDDHLWSLSDALNYVLKKAPSSKRDDLVTLFLSIHHDELQKCPPGVSYFLPKYLGGLGIEHRGVVSDTQLKCAVLRIWHRQPTIMTQVSTKLIEPKASPPVWLTRELVSREWFAPAEPSTFTPGLTHLADKFDFLHPARDWFRLLSPEQKDYVRKSRLSQDWDELLLKAYRAVKMQSQLARYSEDHREWLSLAHRVDFQHKWDWDKCWNRIWAVESVGCGSWPAPKVNVAQVLRAHWTVRDSAISPELD